MRTWHGSLPLIGEISAIHCAFLKYIGPHEPLRPMVAPILERRRTASQWLPPDTPYLFAAKSPVAFGWATAPPHMAPRACPAASAP